MKRALITGASRGLGSTLASFLAGQGYELIVTGRDEAALEAARAELDSRRGEEFEYEALLGNREPPLDYRL